MKIIDVFNNGVEPEIRVEFEHDGKKGLFYYDLAREEVIDVHDYDTTELEGIENIYDIIHEWVNKNITWEVKVNVKKEEEILA